LEARGVTRGAHLLEGIRQRCDDRDEEAHQHYDEQHAFRGMSFQSNWTMRRIGAQHTSDCASKIVPRLAFSQFGYRKARGALRVGSEDSFLRVTLAAALRVTQ
jgi:hypothetical protein